MKIFAFSDWRIQSLEILKKSIADESPDLLLYAGDDLNRFIGNNYNFFNECKVPYFYVNGNDEKLIEKNGKYYLITRNKDYYREGFVPDSISGSILEKFFLDANRKRNDSNWLEKPIQMLFNSSSEHISIHKNGKDYYFYKKGESVITYGIEKRINPLIGQTCFKKDGESISIYGCECSSGLGSDVYNAPNAYADIYLTHIPPLGKLDLSARFGVGHIGSKILLESIKKHQPKLIICGHSHMWGGLVTTIGDTVILNVSSQDNRNYRGQGNYAIIDTDNWTYQMKTIRNAPSVVMRKIRGCKTIDKKLKKLHKLLEHIESNWGKKDGYNLFRNRYYAFRIPIKELQVIKNRIPESRFYIEVLLAVESWESCIKEHRESLRSYIKEHQADFKEYKEYLKSHPAYKSWSEEKLERQARWFYAKKLYLEILKRDKVPRYIQFLDYEFKKTDLKKLKKQIGKVRRIQNDWQEYKSEPITIEQAFGILSRIEELGIDVSTFRKRVRSMESERIDDPLISRGITINTEEQYFVDVETGLARGDTPGELWLIGIGNGTDNKIEQFRFPSEKDDFIRYIKDRDIKSLVSWTRYDSKVLRPILEGEGVELEYYDACARSANCLTWHTYRLHELYNFMFPEKAVDDLIPGRIAGIYADHLIVHKKSSSCPHCSKEEIIKKIMERNRVDIQQMIEICTYLEE
ncbi:MAG: hypothetical protein GF329_22180 [Candidatus Lokiarchaeota archaeon]|nr:hypothetical protein [Candidatus Lokiarchaeota archaeon]